MTGRSIDAWQNNARIRKIGTVTDHYHNNTRATDCLRGSSAKIAAMQRSLALPLRKDDTHKSISVNSILL